MAAKIRTFDTGANRDTDEGKLDYEAFLSPLVLERYAEYLHMHRMASDGTIREGDNWQKGVPLDTYMKSCWRHFIEMWKIHRGWLGKDEMIDWAICGVLFNAMGYLHEVLKRDIEDVKEFVGGRPVVIPPRKDEIRDLRAPRVDADFDPRKYGAGRMSDVDFAREIDRREKEMYPEGTPLSPSGKRWDEWR